jgi:hypothetical protein
MKRQSNTTRENVGCCETEYASLSGINLSLVIDRQSLGVVRFAPKADKKQIVTVCPLCANRDRTQRSTVCARGRGSVGTSQRPSLTTPQHA